MKNSETFQGILWNWFNKCVIILAAVAAICLGASLLYSIVTVRVLDASIRSMEELARHDQASLGKSVKYRWNVLSGVGEECRQMEFETVSQVLDLLRMNEQGLDCADLALVDENGELYSASPFPVSREEAIAALCRAGEKQFVTWQDGKDGDAPYLLFGVRLTPFTVEGKTFTDIVCWFNMEGLAEELKIDSYGGAGYSGVIDREGNYIVSMDRSNGLRIRSNFYTDLEDHGVCKEFSATDIEGKMQRNETFTASFRTELGDTLINFTPVEDVDWYFIMSVPQSVFEAQSIEILRVVLAIVILMVVALCLLLFLILRSRQADAQAHLKQLHWEELSEALSMAEQANRAKTTFLNNMSHDIRTPMNAIIGFTSLAVTHIDEKEQVRDYLEKISQSSSHLLSLINDVLDMSRIESGKMVIEEKPENLAEILHNIRNIIQTDIYSKQLDLYMDAVNVTDEDIFCDKLRLNQILLNLLSNAMKFTSPGGSISVRLVEKESSRPGYGDYQLSVKDTGIGMSEEFAATIFEPFTRERTSTVSGIQGTGLGMSITKNIVDMMEGQIQVRSRKGEGTEFIVSLSFRLQDGRRDPEPIVSLEGFHALVVDDGMDSCQSVCQMLRKTGLRAEWTMYGKEAVARTKEALEIGDSYRIYIIDWLMPDLSGLETARQIRKLVGEEAPIILLSAYDWTDIEKEAREAGVTGFISKPLFQSELNRTLMRLCGEAAEEEIPEQPEETVSFEGRRILLVEDNELNREIATEILQDVGFVIETAENGQEAVEAVKGSDPGYFDAVLMDVQMPVMNGYEASRAIRTLDNPDLANILIIPMTANAFEEDRKTALEAGMNAHVGKPIDVPSLMEVLKEFLK